MDYENKINSVIETAIKNLNVLADADTVIGQPVKYDNGDYVIPVTNVTVGYLSGGGEYGKITVFKKGKDLPFTAGNGAVVSLKPCAFLIKNKDGDYKILTISNEPVERFMDKATDFIEKLNNGD